MSALAATRNQLKFAKLNNIIFMTSAKIIKHSIDPTETRELVTFECTFPRFILAELNTHRMLSRNVASSRAIPIAKMVNSVKSNPFIPSYIGMNQSGMEAEKEVSEEEKKFIIDNWKLASFAACYTAERLSSLGCHKQISNRVLEPWLYVTAIITATEWNNFFNLRCSKHAQPEFAELAYKMLYAFMASDPEVVEYGDYHLPYSDDLEGVDAKDKLMICAGRCARVSYLNHSL